jgi:hypothetical protein
MTPYHPLRVNDFEDVQIVVGDMVSSFAKMMMTLKERQGAADEFLAYFTFTPEMWEMLDIISLAKGWSDIPNHPLSCKCVLCNQLADIH